MKKLLLGFLLPIAGGAYGQAPSSFTVKGKIGNLNAPAKVYLYKGTQAADSATLKNGAFEIKGTTDIPVLANLVLKRNGKQGSGMFGRVERKELYLEPGQIVVTASDSLQDAKVTGGTIAADNQRMDESMKVVLAKMDALKIEYDKATEEERNSPAFKARRDALWPGIIQEYVQGKRDFIRANPNSWVSLTELTRLSMMAPPEYAVVGPLYEALSPTLKNTPQGRYYGELVQELKNVAIGAQAPAFTQKTPDGKTVSLADFRGKYVLIDFWASWCKPCREDNPALVKAYTTYKGRNFEILGVSLDSEESREKWVKAIQEDHLSWPQVSDLRGWKNEAARSYAVHAVPQNYLIDPSGKIVAANLRGEKLTAALAQYLKK